MERYTVTASFKRTTIPPIPTTFNNPEIPHNSQPKDASFSSYLRPTTATSPKPPLDDTELSIFDAERYFNENPDKKHHPKSPVVVERCDLSSTVSRLSSVSSLDGYPRNYRTGSFHATPTASSEASWNSQTGLLSNPRAFSTKEPSFGVALSLLRFAIYQK